MRLLLSFPYFVLHFLVNNKYLPSISTKPHPRINQTQCNELRLNGNSCLPTTQFNRAVIPFPLVTRDTLISTLSQYNILHNKLKFYPPISFHNFQLSAITITSTHHIMQPGTRYSKGEDRRGMIYARLSPFGIEFTNPTYAFQYWSHKRPNTKAGN